jgi:transcriptional regulator of acetoin/glycerol metabolism
VLSDGLRIAFHRRPEFLSTLAEAIVCIDADGLLTGSNSVARKEYGIAVNPAHPTKVADIVGLDFSRLWDLASVNVHQPVRLYVDEQTAVFARIEHYGQPALRVSAAIPAEKIRHPDLQSKDQGNDPLSELDSTDKTVNRVVNRVRKVLNHDLALLVVGPSGCGKRTLAGAIHDASAVADKPLVSVSAASPGESRVADWFSQAAGGTLVIGDVDQLSQTRQAELEALVLSPEFEPARVRLICTAAASLKSRVDNGDFRPDLYHQLNGLTVSLPALAARSDLSDLVQAMLTAIDGSPNPVSDAVFDLLKDSAWPGNLRQLRQLLTSACAVAGPGVELRVEHLPEDFLDSEPPEASSARDLKSVTDSVIDRVLRAHGGNVSSAARELGVSRNTIYRHRRG